MYKRSIATVMLYCLFALVVVGCGSSNTNSPVPVSTQPDAPSATVGPQATPTLAAKFTPVPPRVTGVVITVSPNTFTADSCGTSTSVAFSAAISVANGSTGGSVPYMWDINHSKIAGSATFASGETSKTVTYTLNNYVVQLNSSVTGAITVGNQNSSITSSAVGPTGVCKLPGPFLVQNIAISVVPATIAGQACGTTLTVVYNATVTIAPDSNAGTVQLTWAIGTFASRTSILFAPGETVRTLTYSEVGKLVPGNTNGFPHRVSLASTSPNAVNSTTLKPAGTCK